MQSFQVEYVFYDTTNVILPLVYNVSDPGEGDKSTIIEGIRGNGSLKIPGGKKSQIITVKGYLVNHSGYEALIAAKIAFQTAITTNVATLTCQHFNAGWITDYSYTITRQGEIIWETDSLRTDYISYSINFLVLAY